MSGGERTKVALARLAAEGPNVMVLDEPTNHLDFWACAALERSLREFEGTVLFVSHDRYFLDQVATKIFALDSDRWFLYEGNYTGYQHFQQNILDASASTPSTEHTEQPASPRPDGKPGKPRRKRKYPYRPVEAIEEDITRCEIRVMELEAEMADPETHRNAERMKTIQDDYDEANAELERLMEHWEEAAELN